MYQILEVTGSVGGECYLVLSEQSAVLYDTGFGFSAERMAGRVREALGDRPLDVILLTHSHYDHVLGANTLRALYPAVRTVCSREAAAIFQRKNALALMEKLDAGAAGDAGFPPVPVTHGPVVDVPLRDGEEIRTADMTIRMMATPGHTRCSASYYFVEERLLATSETTGSAPFYPEVCPAFITSYDQAIAAIDRCRALGAAHLLIPHTGLLSGAEAARYWNLARKSAEDAAAFCRALDDQGWGLEEIATAYHRRFYRAAYAALQPERAALINTKAMVRRLLEQ